MRTVPASAAKPRKSALRVNKQESLAAVPVPRSLAELTSASRDAPSTVTRGTRRASAVFPAATTSARQPVSAAPTAAYSTPGTGSRDPLVSRPA
jgi:hypothetical protein